MARSDTIKLETLTTLENLLKKGWEIEISTTSVEIFKRSKNGLGIDAKVEIRVDDRDIAAVVEELLDPLSLPGLEVIPIDEGSAAEIRAIAQSRIHVNVTYTGLGGKIKIKDHDRYDAQNPPVCCGGLTASEECLTAALGGMSMAIKEAKRRQEHK